MPDPSAAPVAAPAPAPSAIDWAAGAALGLLLGLLVGLSASPVVSAVVTGLVALLAAMFGLSDKLPLGLSRAGAHRLTAFALTAAVAVLLGLQLRTHWLAPDVAELKRQLAEVGITEPAEQKAMLRYLRFGLAPDGSKAAEPPKALQSVLYSGSPDFCPNLRKLLIDRAAVHDVLLHLGSGGEIAQRAAPQPGSTARARAHDGVARRAVLPLRLMSAAMLLLAAAVAGADAPTVAQRDKVLASLVQITATQCVDGKDRSGSGFVLDANGRIVTAHHVVGGCGRILVTYEGVKQPASNKRIGSISRVLAAGDLSLLDVAGAPTVPALRLAGQPPSRGANFAGFGYPLGVTTAGDQPVTFSVGASKLSDVLPPALAEELRASGSRIDLQASVLRFNVALQPGMSGGPIVDAAGEVIGVVAGGLRAGAAPASWGWPGDGVRQLLASSEATTQAVRLTAAHYSLQDFKALDSATPAQGRKVRCGDLEFVDAGVRTLAEMLPGTDDERRVQYILDLLNQDRSVILRERFQLWVHRESGATAVVPVGVKFGAEGPACVARSANRVFEQFVWGGVAAGPVGVQVQYQRFEQQIVVPQFGRFANFQIDPHLTTGAMDAYGRYQFITQTRPNGLMFQRKAQFMYQVPPGSGLPQRVSHAFATSVARNDTFLGVATFNRNRPNLIETCMRTPSTSMCREPMAHLQEWLRYLLATQLSTYPST